MMPIESHTGNGGSGETRANICNCILLVVIAVPSLDMRFAAGIIDFVGIRPHLHHHLSVQPDRSLNIENALLGCPCHKLHFQRS
jgi:hypothetical protein